MKLHYAGFNATTLFFNNGDVAFRVESFTEIPFPGITDFHIGWSYFLLRKEKELYICKKTEGSSVGTSIELINIPEMSPDSCKQAAPGKDNIIVLSKSNEMWQYKIHENFWKKVPNFIPRDNLKNEYPVKAIQEGCTVVLTNLGRVFNVPTLVEMPKRVKFIDIACGFDHTILLADNGNIYSMGMGTRGQLGHNDLEDCDNPKLIEALAGIKVVQISAGGWHSAVVTEEGDLYTWGWNTNGELGLINKDSKVVAVPTLIDFTDDRNESIEIFVKKVECGSTFTICISGTCFEKYVYEIFREIVQSKDIFLTDEKTLWGCGSNKYGQLGQPRVLEASPKFIKLQFPENFASIKDFKCREWGTMLITD